MGGPIEIHFRTSYTIILQILLIVKLTVNSTGQNYIIHTFIFNVHFIIQNHSKSTIQKT
jgi:hypothetical protein